MQSFSTRIKQAQPYKTLVAGERIRCAVAFWGHGAAAALFANGRLPPDARIICDICMGGTNPDELKKRGTPDNESLHHVNGLHTKVYISDRDLIAGSANASNNGIGFLSAARLFEAGTFSFPGSDAYTQASEWLERIWSFSNQVDAAALILAESSWRRTPGGGGSHVGRPPDPNSLLETVAADPERFRGIGFLFSTGLSTEQQRDSTVRDIVTRDRARNLPVLSIADGRRLRRWNLGDVFSEWEPQDVYAWPQLFICAHRAVRGGIRYYFYERAYTAILADNRGMVLADRRPGLRR